MDRMNTVLRNGSRPFSGNRAEADRPIARTERQVDVHIDISRYRGF